MTAQINDEKIQILDLQYATNRFDHDTHAKLEEVCRLVIVGSRAMQAFVGFRNDISADTKTPVNWDAPPEKYKILNCVFLLFDASELTEYRLIVSKVNGWRNESGCTDFLLIVCTIYSPGEQREVMMNIDSSNSNCYLSIHLFGEFDVYAAMRTLLPSTYMSNEVQLDFDDVEAFSKLGSEVCFSYAEILPDETYMMLGKRLFALLSDKPNPKGVISFIECADDLKMREYKELLRAMNQGLHRNGNDVDFFRLAVKFNMPMGKLRISSAFIF